MNEQTAFLSVLILLLVLAVAWLQHLLFDVRKRMSALSRIDAKLDLLLKQAGIDYDPYKNLPRAVVEAMQRGNKIEAIKHYREAAGVGLKEAKDFIEEVERRAGT